MSDTFRGAAPVRVSPSLHPKHPHAEQGSTQLPRDGPYQPGSPLSAWHKLPAPRLQHPPAPRVARDTRHEGLEGRQQGAVRCEGWGEDAGGWRRWEGG